MRMLTKGLCLIGVGLIASFGLARVTAASVPISIQHDGVSKAGKFLAHEVRQEVSASNALRMGEDVDEGWKLVLLTSEGEGGTFYSVILVRKQFEEVFDQYVVAFQGICPVERLEYCARDIVEKIEEPTSQFEADWQDLTGPDKSVSQK